MQPSRRPCIYALLALFAGLLLSAPRTHADTLTITSTPVGATVEIDGVIVGTTPCRINYPGGYFHKTHTAFGARLEHAMTARVYKDGYVSHEITLTEGPFEWVAVTGKVRGRYWLLKSNQIQVTLQPVSK